MSSAAPSRRSKIPNPSTAPTGPAAPVVMASPEAAAPPPVESTYAASPHAGPQIVTSPRNVVAGLDEPCSPLVRYMNTVMAKPEEAEEQVEFLQAKLGDFTLNEIELHFARFSEHRAVELARSTLTEDSKRAAQFMETAFKDAVKTKLQAIPDDDDDEDFSRSARKDRDEKKWDNATAAQMRAIIDGLEKERDASRSRISAGLVSQKLIRARMKLLHKGAEEHALARVGGPRSLEAVNDEIDAHIKRGGSVAGTTILLREREMALTARAAEHVATFKAQVERLAHEVRVEQIERIEMQIKDHLSKVAGHAGAMSVYEAYSKALTTQKTIAEAEAVSEQRRISAAQQAAAEKRQRDFAKEMRTARDDFANASNADEREGVVSSLRARFTSTPVEFRALLKQTILQLERDDALTEASDLRNALEEDRLYRTHERRLPQDDVLVRTFSQVLALDPLTKLSQTETIQVAGKLSAWMEEHVRDFDACDDIAAVQAKLQELDVGGSIARYRDPKCFGALTQNTHTFLGQHRKDPGYYNFTYLNTMAADLLKQGIL